MATYKERYDERKKNRTTYGARYAQRMYLNNPDEFKAIGEQLSSRVDTWLQNHNNYISNYNNRYSGRNFDYSDSYVSDSSDYLKTVATQKNAFDREAANILSYLERYKDFFNEDYVKSVTDTLKSARNQQSSVLKSAVEDKSYWSNFKTQEDYDTSVRIYGPNGYQQKYSDMGYDEIISSLSSLSDGEEKDWLSYNQSTLLKNALAKNDDFDELTKYTPTGTGEWKRNFWSGNITHDYSDIQYDYINRNEKAIEIKGANDINNNSALYGYDKSFLQQMTDDEIAIYNYLYKKNGKDAANEYLSYMESEFTRRDREAAQKEWAEYSKANPVTSSLFSAIMAPTKVLSAVGQLADYADDGTIDQNAAYNKFSYIPSTIREQVSSDIESGAWGAVGSYGYQIGMSMADFLVTTVATGGPMTGGVGEILNLGLMGSGAMADTVISAKDRGLSDEQALTLGVVAGGAEALFEKIGIDALFKSNMAEGAFKYIVKNMASEGLEEGGTNIVNFLTDLIVSKDKSEWNIAINEYMSQGMTEKEAFIKAMGDQALSLGLDILGGAISGGALGGVGAIGNYIFNARPGIQANKDALETYAPVQSELVAEGLESKKGSDSNILAREYQKILDKGKNLSGYQIRSLVEANDAQFAKEYVDTDIDTIAGAAKERLTILGESGKLEVLAQAIAKQTAGETLTVFEKNAIKNSKFGNRVINELNAENIRSGQYSSEWTGGIGTNVINAEEYGRIVAAIDNEQGASTHKISSNKARATLGESNSLPDVTNATEGEKSAPTKGEERIVDGNKTLTEVTNDAPSATKEVQSTAKAETVDTETSDTSTVTLEKASKKYGAQAQAMVHTYTEGQDVAKYDEAYKVAYDMGASGVSIDYAKKSETASYLTERQIELAHEAGKASSDERAKVRDERNKAAANGNTGRKKGTVKGEGVTISDLKKRFNDQQNKAYKILVDVAEATGIDIVLYKSEANADGKYEGAQGRFDHSDDKIYIDVNAGLATIKDASDLQKYALLRTFSHEFVHFIEKWNPIMYNEFRKVVFDTLTERGENIDNLIKIKLGLDRSGKMTYEKASREVVAEAMTDVLPDSHFVQELAQKHKTLLGKLIERLKEFVSNLKAYFSSLGSNPSREANALKDGIAYVENIVKALDNAAVHAVENYQSTVATEEKAEKIDSTETIKAEENVKTQEVVAENATTSDEVTEETAAEGDSFTITDNAEYGTLEVKFDGKPSEAVRDVLKAHSFRWHRTKGVWYGKASREDLVTALRSVYESENAQTSEVTETIKEERNNGENADNTGTVSETLSDGERTSRLLDESQAEDVQGASSGRSTVGSSVQEESGSGRDSSREHSGTGDSRSEGTGEVGDLRRDDGLSEEESTAKAEELHETVNEQIEQKSTEKPKGNNFVIGDSLNLPDGEKARYRANIDAIRLIKQLETEGRNATAAEQEVLSKYVGWGGLSNAFGEMVWNRETRKQEMKAKSGWESEFAEFRALVDEGVITEEEYKAASGSTKNAHYTSIEVIKAMYDGLKSLGFNGGRMLEPSSGVGHFVGAMPSDMSAKVNSWTMVELDRITGQIAKHLYPNSDVRIQGFETANIPDNYMDVAIGNVPFGDFGVVDRAYPKRITASIHNYFFAKSLDKVRPGGIVMFITSSFTMNGSETAVREYIMERADLLGAIRLPNTAFKGNAGTEVVTDILILKKRAPGTEYNGEAFLNAPYKNIDGYRGGYINEYFENHPEMALGTPTLSRGMYGAETLTYKPFTDRGELGDQIRAAFKNIKGQMDYTARMTPEKTNFAVERANKKTKQGGYVANPDGSISVNENGELKKVDTDAKTAKRISGMLSIRDAYRTLASYLQQGQEEKFIKKARKTLNDAYDSFVKEYGYLNSNVNKAAFSSDPDVYAVLSLENYDTKKKTATKADIFTKNTISPNKTITHVDDVKSGVIASINMTGGVDTSLIAKLTDKSEAEVTRELIDGRMAFKTRDGEMVSRESYLSGNVRAKLREAEALAPLDKDFTNNVEELKKVIPADIPYNEIYVSPGAAFVPNEVYADFIAEMLGGHNSAASYRGPDVTVGRTVSGDFKIVINNARLKVGHLNTQKWGTDRRSFLDLIEAMMSSRSVTVSDTVEDPLTGKKKSVVNKVATAAANEKVEAITKEFQEWIWRDETRRNELARLYNETYNALVTPKYDGANLSVNGINAEYSLREHQANAVQRIISSGGNTLLAHRVGAGKTLEMASAAMKLRELGLVKKPVFVVPKSLVAQWGTEFHSYFPASKLLVADEKSFAANNRKTFANRIANGDFDAVILSYEQFEKIPMSKEYQRQFYEEQINEIIAAIAEEKAETKGKGITVKEMEKKRAQLEKKLAELSTKEKDEDNIDFEQLGIDSLFVDEAHNFKNLQYVTRMNNIAGLGNQNGSQRAFDLYTKVRYLQQVNGGRGIVFATATPVMNSMAEMYIMQKYLQSDVLKQLGLNSFDAWAKQFGEVVNSIEIKPSGQGFRVKQTFSNFRNLNELQLLFRSFSDVLTEVPGLKIPKMKGGKVKTVECESGEFQKDYMKKLEERAENVKNVDPSVDNMLKITSDGRKISYTQRMIDPTLPYEPGCKIYKCCDNVLEEYKNSKAIKGTQIVFCDMATPKGKSKNVNDTAENIDDTLDTESARLYDDMRAYLIKQGIPAKEIAFIHEADTDAKKKQLFEDVNEGKVRVLIGSTGKMGVGMNAQKRIVAIHHLDAPWRPGDVEQRDGRAFRQKNMNEEVSKYVYVTTGSFDARLWDILDRKQHFINQIMNGEDVGRTAEDTGEVTLSAAEVKALASGNPLIMEQVQLTSEISKLEDLKKAYNSEVVRAKTKLAEDEQKIATYTTRIERAKIDVKARVDTYSEGKFSMTVGKQTFTDKKDAGVALAAEILAKANDEFTTVGKFAGFELKVVKQGAEYFGSIYGKQGYKFNVYPNNTTYMVNHIIGVVQGLETMIENYTQELNNTITDRDAQQKIIAEPFARQAELDTKRARFNEVMEILNPKEEQQLDSADDEVQAQSRDYLDEGDDIQYQQRTNTLSDREILRLAAEDIMQIEGLSEGEQDALRIFTERLEALETLHDKRAEEGRLYKDQQFGANVDRNAAAETLNRMHLLDEKIEKASADLLDVENKKVFKGILQKARNVVEKNQRAHDQEILDRWRSRQKDTAAIKKYRERIAKDVKDMSDWALNPNNKDIMRHIPEVLKDSVIPFITSIDFTSKKQLSGKDATKADKAFRERLEKLTAAVRSVDARVLYNGNYDLSPNFLPNLELLVSSVKAITEKHSGTYVINQMTSEELRALSHVVRNLKSFVKQVNRFHYNAMFQFVSDAGDSTIEELSSMAGAKRRTEAGEKANNWVFWENIRPAYAFERFGEGGAAIYDGLRRGQSKLAFNTKEIVNFADATYTAEQVQKWSKDVIEVEISGGKVRMPVAMAMSLYELSKDKDGSRHILEGGVRVATFKDSDKKITADDGHKLAQKDVFAIIDALTDEQKAVADKLQKFMAEVGGKWGNYVSVKRFGEELFGNPTYFPINSDGQHLEATVEEHPNEASLYALLNLSFTKARNEFANNRVILYNIFDVFANHMASMAQYNALALPVLDAIKWFNYQQKSEPDEFGNTALISTVREQMDRVYGVPNDRKPGSGNKGYAQQFVLGILKDFNGTGPQGTPYDSLGMKGLHVYNKAQIAFNFRVAIQQPLAITRAAMLVGADSIFKGMKLKDVKNNIEEMQKYSGIAAWKDLGFYDVNISRGVTQLIKHDESKIDKITDVGMWAAEKLDVLTWAGIWSACKEQVKKNNKNKINPSDASFYKEVTKLFEDVIYKTQVVDSILTKSEYMRSKGLFARVTSSFMSEPVTTASMVLDAYDKYRTDMQRGMTMQQAWKKNGKSIGRLVAVYSAGMLINAAVQAIADGLRDDDDYQTFLEKWLEAFGGNVIDEAMPFNKLPIVSDFYDLAKSLLSVLGVDTYGNPPQSVFMQWYDSLVKGADIIYDKITGEDTNYTWYGGIYKLLQAASGITGLPGATLTRDVITIWNNTIGAMAPSLKVKDYDPSDLSNIKYAYLDGYLTSEEATRELISKGIAEDENDAYFYIQEWDSGEDSYSRYDKIYSAMLKGESIDSAVDELVSHGYKEKQVKSTIKSGIGKRYKDGEISKQQAIDILTKYAEYFEMSGDDITKLVNEWSAKVVTGIEYNDIKSEFMDGNITKSRAIEMYVRYGGLSKEDATDKVSLYEFVKAHPVADGVIASYNTVKAYNEYCADVNVSVETFCDVWKYKSGKKKEEILEYIDSLDLTRKQKNSLYYALGYAESNLWEAPW